jgi:hypothetical protein
VLPGIAPAQGFAIISPTQSYACRLGFGSHKALQAVARACRAFPYLLQCDIRKYFPSIDHEILKAQLVRVVKCAPTLRLASLIIEGSNRQEAVEAYFPGERLVYTWRATARVAARQSDIPVFR